MLVCLAQRYLRLEPQPQPQPRPLTWDQVAFEPGKLQPDERWTTSRAAHIVANVRTRLSKKAGAPGRLEE